MAQEIYVVIEFDRETHEFSEIEAICQSKEEAENLVKDHNAKFLRYSYEWFEETYHAEEVDAVLAEKDAAIAELNAKLESVQASMDADLIDAGMENRRLKRALYKACANWALAESYSILNDVPTANRWVHALNKCRAKTEEYK